jgi:hypothetical protein
MPKIAQTHTRFRRLRLTAFTVVAGAMFALVPATQAAARHVDLRSPDARDAVLAAAPAKVDLRSPDARDAARAVTPAKLVDLRSPDARDAGRRIPVAPTSSGEPSGGFDWTYFAIGGGVLLVALAAAGTIRRRRSPKPSPVPIQS